MMRGATAVGLATAGGGVAALFCVMALLQGLYGERDNKSLYLAVAGFGLGAAFVALCTRLCGVVYMKSAAVGVRIVQQQARVPSLLVPTLEG
jgi:Na+/H+-translocating membrane pyrophosphatase